MAATVVDITSLYAVESLFRPGTQDPWGKKVAGRLADLFIFSNEARFTMPVHAEAATLEDPSLPPLLEQLRSRDPGVLTPLTYVVDEPRRLRHEYLEPAFHSFAAWAVNNKSALKRWLLLHDEIRRSPSDISHIRPRSVFDIASLLDAGEFKRVTADLRLSAADLIYAFDIVLRYPLYGEVAGSGSYFLAHPIREQQAPPIILTERGPAPPIPISLSQAVSAMASSMTLDEYTSFLHEARGYIRGRQIHRLRSVDTETTREIASELSLPARLKKVNLTVGIWAGVIGIAGAVPALAPAAVIVGGLVQMVSAAWSGSVGRAAGRVSWLRWALEWDLERQASDDR